MRRCTDQPVMSAAASAAHVLLHVPGAAPSSLPSQQSQTPSLTSMLDTRWGAPVRQWKCPCAHAAVPYSSVPSAQSQ